ncbi:hypothetical protein [Streptomyces europaeiscabiei]|uniref:hypothetical protein n=1 Tax=Streptomyces europaeiscabiei TaxID=146819 RepID=UPI002E100069|nr:hypothetical protein OHB30_11135 [Streptomyces europaeiscabiei]
MAWQYRVRTPDGNELGRRMLRANDEAIRWVLELVMPSAPTQYDFLVLEAESAPGDWEYVENVQRSKAD